MLCSLSAFIVAVVALFVAYRAVNILLKNSWFIAWLRGTFGLGLLVLSGFVGLIAYDIFSYKQILSGQPVATISFDSSEVQQFTATVVARNGQQQVFNLHGDQWQLNARIVKFKGLLSIFDINPAYRLDRLSGRFYDIHKETSEKRTAYSIVTSVLDVDAWHFIYDHPQWFPIVDASYGSATYLPMKNGALYEINLSNTGLTTRPLNDAAKKAVSEWN